MLLYKYAAELGFSLDDLELGLCLTGGNTPIPYLAAQSAVRATIADDPWPKVFSLLPLFTRGAGEALPGLDFVGTVSVTCDVPGDCVTLACTLEYD